MVAYYDSVIDDPVTYQATIQTFFFLTSIAMVTEDTLCIHLSSKIGILALFGSSVAWLELLLERKFYNDFNENCSQNRLYRNAARRDIQLGEGIF